MTKIKIGILYTHAMTISGTRHFYKVVGWLGDNSLVYRKVTKSGRRVNGHQMAWTTLDNFSDYYREATTKEKK